MHLCFILGTRPEGIKLAPLIIKARDDGIKCTVISTGQHREILNDVLKFFKIKVDISLRLMTHNQDLCSLSSKILNKVSLCLKKINPTFVITQGDTLTTLFGSLSAFLNNYKVLHVEAGLRTDNLFSPFPEEGNRRLVTQIASLNFAATQNAKIALLKELKPVEWTEVEKLSEGKKDDKSQASIQ